MGFKIGCGLLLLLIFSRCTSSEEKLEKEIAGNSDNIEELQVFEPMNNPALVYGSSFGVYMQTLHNLSKYEEMYQFTCLETKMKFGKDALINFFSEMEFTYPLDLIAYDTLESQLIYKTTIMATEKKLIFPVIIENDSVKMVFDSLNIQEPFPVY